MFSLMDYDFLVSYLKTPHQTQGHIDFLQYCLLGVLEPCSVHLGMIHFELNFVKRMRSVSRCLFSPAFCLLKSIAQFLKKVIFLHQVDFAFWSKISLFMWVCFGLSILSHYSIIYSFASTTLPWLQNLDSKSWTLKVSVVWHFPSSILY